MLEKSCRWWLIWYFLFFFHGGVEATESRLYMVPDIIQSSKVMSPQGQPLVINCGIDGFPKPLITWYKPLEVMSPDNRVSVLSNGSLHFMRLTTGDQGYYYCHGKHLGQVKSARIFVEVAYINPHFEQEPDSQYIRGKSRTLPCSPPASHPPANVTWYKDNQPMKYRTGEHAAYILDPAKSIWDLFFTDIQKQDEGRYFCIASNHFAVPMSRTSKSADIQIEGQLQWVVKEKVTDYGQNLILFCPVENCCSKHQAGWFVGGKSKILDVKTFSNDPNSKYHGTYNTDGFGLVIRNLSEADLDVIYHCNYGFNQSTPTILLHSDVFKESHLQWVVKEKITDYGQDLTLFCPVENCCSKHQAGWFVGGKSKILDVKTFSNDPNSKYHGTYNTEGFGFVIRNLSEADLNVTYHCNYGFNESTPTLLLHGDVFKESVPDKDKDKENNTVTENNTVAIVIAIVGSIVVAGIVVGAIIVYIIKKKRRTQGESPSNQDEIPLIERNGWANTNQQLNPVYQQDLEKMIKAIEKRYRTDPKIPNDFLNDIDFLSELLKECGKNTEGLLPYSSEGIDVGYFPATLLVVVMKYGTKTEIVEEVLNYMSTTLTSQSPSTVVIVHHRSVKTAIEKVCKDCKTSMDKEDCEKQIEIFRKFIEKHKFYYSASSCLQQCIYT